MNDATLLRAQARIDEYNKYISTHKDLASVNVCKKNKLNLPIKVVHFHNYDPEEIQSMNGICITAKLSYLACIDFHPHVECEDVVKNKHHICDIFPVLLGSDLDKRICMERFKKYVNHYTSIGSYIFDGALTIIPIVLTNRKEFFHKTAENDAKLVLYVYDKLDRGVKVHMDANRKIIYNDRHGQPSDEFPDDAELSIERRHRAPNLFSPAFVRLYGFSMEIDSLENKLTLSQINIFEKLLNMAVKRRKQAVELISRGYIEKFTSTNISFLESRKPKYLGDQRGSCNFRKLQPNQIARGGFDKTVIKPMASNVCLSVISDSEYYLCLIEKNVSIDSFNRTMYMLSNVVISSEADYINDINGLLDWMFQNKYICEYDEALSMIMVNGGFPTKYSTSLDKMTIFHVVKSYNKYIEVTAGDDFFIFTQCCGLPFIEFEFNGQTLVTSPIELNRLFPEYKLVSKDTLFGENIPEESRRDAQVANLTKSSVAAGFHKNRFGSLTGQRYFESTSENHCMYVDGDAWDPVNETAKLNTVFSSNPQLTADGYILSKDVDLNFTVNHRSKYEMELPDDAKCTFFNVSSKDCTFVLDKKGNVLRKALCVVKIQKLGTPLSPRVYSQTKFMITSDKIPGGHEYNLYKYFDERDALMDEFDIKSMAIETLDRRRRRLMYSITISCKRTNIDGIKLSNMSSQKGVSTRQDTSRYLETIGRKVDVVASIFTIPGRTPHPQLKSIYRKRTITKNPPQLVGYDNYDILKNMSSTIKSTAPIKHCMYSMKVHQTNNLGLCNYSMAQRTFNERERGKFLPEEKRNELSIINALKCYFEFSDNHGNVFSDFNVNKGIK